MSCQLFEVLATMPKIYFCKRGECEKRKSAIWDEFLCTQKLFWISTCSREKNLCGNYQQWNGNNPIECQKHTKNAENQNPLLIALITSKWGYESWGWERERIIIISVGIVSLCWWCCFKAKLSEILIRIKELISAHLPGNPFVCIHTHTLSNPEMASQASGGKSCTTL